ncbi:unnamed protein product, partial [marine sediment metagenome]
DDANLENDPTIGTEFNDTEYAGIASSDDVRTEHRAILWYDYTQQIYGFKVKAPTQISEFTLHWEGYITFVEEEYPQIEKLLIWNNDTGSWELVSTAFNVYEETGVPPNPAGQEAGKKSAIKKLPKWLLIGVLAATSAGAAVGTILTADVVG